MEIFWGLFVLFVIGAMLWSKYGKVKNPKARGNAKRGAKSSVSRNHVPVADFPRHHWDQSGNFDFEIVGEASYQNALAEVVGPHGDQFVEKEFTALLFPDNSNPYDDKAVAVFAGGSLVGYLSRDNARSFRRRLGAKKLGGLTTSCNAVVRGGGIKNGERFNYGVWLDMKTF